MAEDTEKNLFGTDLEPCSMDPLTGFLRDGCCHAHEQDQGLHLVCALVTEQFLEFSKAKGNDLVTPRPEFGFPGLKPGDSWCLCAARWLESYRENMAPPIKGKSTHEKALEVIDFHLINKYAIQ